MSKIRSALILIVVAVSSAAQPTQHKYAYPDIICIDASLPLDMNMIDLYSHASVPPAVVIDKIEHVLKDFYEEFGGDPEEKNMKIRNSYIATVRVPFNNMDLYIVVLQTPMPAFHHCRLFIYNPATNKTGGQVIDLNIWATYNYENGMLTPAMKKVLHLTYHDMVEFGPPGNKKLTLTRIVHNGSYNAVEKVTYGLRGLVLDTLSSQSESVDVMNKK